jgi:hypothetical protein
MRNDTAEIAVILLALIGPSQAKLAALELALDEGGLEMTATWGSESEAKGFSLQAEFDAVNIFWTADNSDYKDLELLKIMPRDYGVDFEYRIKIEAAGQLRSESGLIKMNLARSRDYKTVDWCVGFYYDYTNYINAGIETSGEALEGATRFSVRPIAALKLGELGHINGGFDIASLITGALFDALYFDIGFKWKW